MWLEMSEEKRKALRVLITYKYGGIDNMAQDIGKSKSILFLKLKGEVKFKKCEYEQILQLLNMTDEQIEKCSKSYILRVIP